MIVSDFKKWLDLNTAKMERYGLKLVERLESAESMVLEYENEDFYTELTIRDNGFQDIEINKINKEKTELELRFYLHCMTDKTLDINSLMDNYLNYFDEFYNNAKICIIIHATKRTVRRCLNSWRY